MVEEEIEDLNRQLLTAIENACEEEKKMQTLESSPVKDAVYDAQKNLHVVTKKNYIEIVFALIEKGADVNAVREDAVRKDQYFETSETGGKTALMIVVEGGSIELAQVLIDAGADVNARNGGGWTALVLAAASGNKEMVEFLLDKGADINARPKSHGKTALIDAVYAGNKEMVEFLLEKGARPPTPKECYFGRPDSAIAALLLARWEELGKALLEAAKNGETENVRALIEKGADVTMQDYYRKTALQVATENSHTETASVIQHGMDMKLLEDAKYRGTADSIKALLDAGADVNWTDDFGMTPLMNAVCARRGDDVVLLLVSYGADINKRDGFGKTALMYEINDEWERSITPCLIAGADLNIQDKDGMTALMHAARLNRYKTVKCLLDAKAGLDIQDKNGMTALMHAIDSKRNSAVLHALLYAGADPTIRDNNGKNMLDYMRAAGWATDDPSITKYIDKWNSRKQATAA
ncbi:MAG: ankyrin repeat domain-containing protein [Candidatus Burarchaeum sp.]|nr:ankyrin repeat domain-containing protein [Candidatus Burarchaeum sp.]MDO8339236.1 ankyrin repeat domain-containing protein [Candidatus Burarchaeum sp.]